MTADETAQVVETFAHLALSASVIVAECLHTEVSESSFSNVGSSSRALSSGGWRAKFNPRRHVSLLDTSASNRTL